jgi:hypothetical protein
MKSIGKWMVVLALCVLIVPLSGTPVPGDELVGTWKLVSVKDTTESGEMKDGYGRNPSGFLTYTADGRMMAILAHGDRKPLSVEDAVGAPAEERAKAFATFAAYAGTYTHEGNMVVHHVEISSVQNRVHTDLTRTIVALQGDRLILRTPPFLRGGAKVTSELVWERWKASR